MSPEFYLGLPIPLVTVLGAGGSFAESAADLAARYGETPDEGFVQDNWHVLFETWLAHDAAARASIVGQLADSGFWRPPPDLGSETASMSYLRGCYRTPLLVGMVWRTLMATDPGTPRAGRREPGEYELQDLFPFISTVRRDAEPESAGRPRPAGPAFALDAGYVRWLTLVAMGFPNAVLADLFPAIGPGTAGWTDVDPDLQILRDELAYIGVEGWADLLPLTLLDVWTLPGSDWSSVFRIVHLCVSATASLSVGQLDGLDVTVSDAEPVSRAVLRPVESGPDAPQDGWVAAGPSGPLASFPVIASWAVAERDAASAGDVWQLSSAMQPSESVVSAWEDFAATPLADLADPNLAGPRAAARAVHDYVDSLTDLQRDVLINRVLSDEPDTLERVASRHGLTRERVRQVQTVVVSTLGREVRGDRWLALRWRADDLAAALGAGAPVSSTVTAAALSRACRGFDVTGGVDKPVVRGLLLMMAGEYKTRAGWLIRAGTGLPTSGDFLAAVADADGLADRAAVLDWLAGHGVATDLLQDWIEHAGGLRSVGGVVVAWPRSVVDRCHSLLVVRGEPATMEDLLSGMDGTYSVRSVRQRLFDDDRFVRVNPREWALGAWGLEEYTGIAEEIEQRIQEAGGSAWVDEVVGELVAVFGVAAASVRAYAASDLFIITNGQIRIRATGEADVDPAAKLSRGRGVFRRGDAVLSWVLRVDQDMLRGSGRACPRGLAVAVGVGPGSERIFDGGQGQLRLVWARGSGSGPTVGSSRRFAETTGAEDGDMVRLDLDLVGGTIDAFRVSRDWLTSAPPGERVALITGLDVGPDALGRVAAAIETPLDGCIDALRRRGDTDVADALDSLDS